MQNGRLCCSEKLYVMLTYLGKISRHVSVRAPLFFVLIPQGQKVDILEETFNKQLWPLDHMGGNPAGLLLQNFQNNVIYCWYNLNKA